MISELRERRAEYMKADDESSLYRASEASKILDLVLAGYAARWGTKYTLPDKDPE